MKAKRYRGKDSRSGKYIEGFYYQQPSYTRSPMNESKEPIPIEHYILMAMPGDWNLPYNVHAIPVDPSTIEELDEVEVNQAEASKKEIYVAYMTEDDDMGNTARVEILDVFVNEESAAKYCKEEEEGSGDDFHYYYDHFEVKE